MPTTTNFGWTTPADTDLVKDGAAAIRTLGNSIDTSLVDLKGGTTGQVLAKASNTDMDFSWVVQDDSNAIQNSIVDAKGDLITATANDTPARLAVGTNGQVLKADSTTATGLIWGSVSTADSFTLLNSGSTALSGAATRTVSSISGKDKIFIVVTNASAAANDYFRIRINGVSTTTYTLAGPANNTPSTYSAGQFNGVSDPSETGWILGKLSSNAASNLSGGMMIYGCNSTGTKVAHWVAAPTTSTGTDPESRFSFGYQGDANAVTSVSIVSSGGNFDAGSWFVYGA
jgi:hypothetical protein